MYSSSTVDINYADIDSSLTNQIDAIAQQVADDNSDLKEVGLLGGKAGIVLLFAYLSRIFPQNYLQATFDLLNELSDSLANDELDFHMSAGVAGIGFSFQHLRNMGVLDKSEDLNLSEIDEFINLGIDNDFNTGNWDPLHGMVGLGIYFLERHKETGEKKYLEKIVDYLSTMRVTVGEHKVWITTGYGKYNNDNYNFGTAHGMPGILSFLAQVHTRGIKQPAIEEMISGCFPFLLQHEYKEDMEYSFPNSIDVNPAEKETDSRLAWCYGDLCMANAFIHCAKALKRNDWKVKGIEVALKTTKRNFESSGCVDAPFCHGAVGLVHQYNRLYKLTNNDVFKYTAENWLHITQKHFYKPGEGAGGYFFRTHNEEKKIFEMTANYSLLEGSAGIALVYLSWLHDIDPGWDIIFLTNV